MTSKNELVPKEVHLANAGLKNLPAHWSVVEVGELLSEDRGISVAIVLKVKRNWEKSCAL